MLTKIQAKRSSFVVDDIPTSGLCLWKAVWKYLMRTIKKRIHPFEKYEHL